MRRWLPALLLLLCAAVSSSCSRSEPARPNVVFVLVDDMNERLMPYLPRLTQLLPAKGMTLHMTVPTPVCAPSRATILTGKYSHNTGVKTNGVWAGGIWAFRGRGNETKTFPIWLHDVGYQTGAFGKYLNGHEGKELDIPPGWDSWVSYKKVSFSRYGYEVFETGATSRTIDRIYDTDYFAQEAAGFLATAREPFLAVFTPMSPHGPFVSPKRHRHRFDDVELSFPPSFSADEAEVEQLTRTRLEMMLSVEDAMARFIETLEKRGVLDRTYIVFTSDHGLFMGEHGFAAGKGEPYEEVIRVPIFVRGPGVPVASNDALLSSVDLAPTFAAMAGASVPPDVDGRSFLPLLHGEPLPQPRKRALIEWFDNLGKVLWQGIRTQNAKYVRYPDGTCKSFRLDADPYEMDGQPCDDAFAKESSAHIDRLVACAGASCAAADSE